jgi:hypothetical protein
MATAQREVWTGAQLQGVAAELAQPGQAGGASTWMSVQERLDVSDGPGCFGLGVWSALCGGDRVVVLGWVFVGQCHWSPGFA